MTRKKVSVWLDPETDQRAEALVPAIKSLRGYRHSRVSRALVLQLALDRGLEVLEHETLSARPAAVVAELRATGAAPLPVAVAVEPLPAGAALPGSSDTRVASELAAPGVGPVAPGTAPDAAPAVAPPGAGGAPLAALTPEAMAGLAGLGAAIRAGSKK